MMRGTLTVLVLACAVASSEAGDKAKQATHLYRVTPMAKLKRVVPADGPRAAFPVEIDVYMPSPGYTLTLASVAEPDATGRIVVRLDGKPKPGTWPAAMTWMPARFTLASLPTARYLVDVQVRVPPHGYKRYGAFLLDALRGP